jgi:micrococcal nuclease
MIPSHRGGLGDTLSGDFAMPRRSRRPIRSAPIIRLRRRRIVVSLFTLIIVAALVLADRRGWLLVRHVDDMAAYDGVKARVTRVIDGDTIEVDVPDALNNRPGTRIRLWGIDCPEAANFGKPAQPWAAEATAYAQSVCDGGLVILDLEPGRTRDSFSRVLAHVTLEDGRSLNEQLLEAGLAKADDRWPHGKLVRHAQLDMAARRRGAGVWHKSNPH